MTSSGTHDGCLPVRHALGGLVLGALGACESRSVRRHLAACPGCRQEYEELSAVPPLLALLSRADAEAAVAAAPADVVPPADAAPTPRRHGRPRTSRTGRWLVAAASVAVLAAAGVAAWPRAGDQPAPAHVASATDRATGVSADVSVQPVSWGSKLTLALHNAPLGSSCSLVVVGRHGERKTAATWTAAHGGNLTVPGAVAMWPQDISRFDIETFDGHRLVSVPE